MKKQNIEIVIKGKNDDPVDAGWLMDRIQKEYPNFEIKLVRVEATNE